jgi:Glycosyltransferase Family 4
VTDHASSRALDGSNRLTVLITNLSPLQADASNAAVDLAQGLSRRGHRPIVFSPGASTAAVVALRQSGVTVVDRLNQVAIAPDIIHGQGNVAAVMAIAAFPSCPVVFACCSPDSAADRPPLLPRIKRYVAVDDRCRDRLLRDGVRADRIVLLQAAIDPDSDVAQFEKVYADVLSDESPLDPPAEMRALGVFLEDFLISPDLSRPWTALYGAITGEAVDVQEQALKSHIGRLQEALLARFDDLERRIGGAPARPARKQVQPIDLSTALRHGDASAEFGNDLSITTARGQWQYAVTLACPPITEPGTIVVDAQVEKGSIGFGLNGPDLKAYVGDEMVLEAGDGRQKVEIPVSGDAPRRLVLVLRNVSDRGRSRGTIFGAAAVTEG